MRAPVVVPADTFARFGFFLAPGFLPKDRCARLRRLLRTAPAVPGEVWKGGRRVRSTAYRRVDVLQVPPRVRAALDRRLRKLLPRLAAHFGRRLEDHEPLQFLRYRPGGRYGLHTDRTPGTRDPGVRRRKVSVIVLLNRPAAGGELVFPARRGPRDRGRVPLAVPPEPGLLVAFDPGIEHEVRPVRRGLRFSLATWFV